MSLTSHIRLAVLGMIEGNGHPWSWSAIINGFDVVAMEHCPYPTIRQYLGARSPGSVGIDGVRVTHIWTDDLAEAAPIARACGIDNVVNRPEDVIGNVDAVIIAVDDGDDHVRRAAPFIEAGLPVFIDKPLATNMADLRQFAMWHREGKVILSTSGMRYAPEMEQASLLSRDGLRWISSVTCKSWERYGIHALEAVYPVLGAGFETVQAVARPGMDLMQIAHKSGCMVTVAAIHDAVGSFGSVHLYAIDGHMAISLTDTYSAFCGQLVAFVEMLRTGSAPFVFEQTLELMLIIIAGMRSKESGGSIVKLEELWRELEETGC